MGRLLPRYIAYYLVVVYYAVAGVVLKVSRRQIKDSLSTTVIQVATVLEFVWIRR